MRKTTKALAAVLLLAIVVSAFALFSTFAAEGVAAESDLDYGRIVVRDLDKLNSVSVANFKPGDSMTKITNEETGETYWQHRHNAAEDIGDFWKIDPVTTSASNELSMYIADAYQTETVTKTTTVTLKDGSTEEVSHSYVQLKKDADGNYIKKADKNTDYIIIDFDISTDTTYIPGVLFHTRSVRDDGKTGSSDIAQDSNCYIGFNYGHAGTDVLYVGKNSGTSGWTNPVDADDRWTNVTIIYDFSADLDVNAIQSGTISADHKGYIYIDGYLVGEISGNFYKAFVTSVKDSTGAKHNVYNTDNYVRYGKMLTDIRVETISTLNLGDVTTNYKNLTVSKFPANYAGPLTEDGMLGNYAVNIASLADLAYCFENTPENPEGYTGMKIADIQRGDETIPVYDEDDLSGDLVAGDVVTLYRDLTTSIVVRSATSEAGVTFVDKDGKTAGNSDSLVKAPTIIIAPMDVDWVIIHGGAVQASGNKENQIAYYDEATGKWLIHDEIYAGLSAKKNLTLMLFDDVAVYGATGSSSENINGTGLKTTTSSVFKPGDYTWTFDLNGHTMTMDPQAAHFTQPSGSFKLAIKNGTYIFCGGASNIAQNGSCGAGTKITFEHLTLKFTSGTMIDHRKGQVRLVNCYVETYDAISSMKSHGGNVSGLVIDKCTVKATAAEAPVYGGNTNSAQGSSRNSIAIIDSVFTTGTNTSTAVVRLAPAADNKNTSGEAIKNDNRAYVSMIRTDVTGKYTYVIRQNSPSSGYTDIKPYSSKHEDFKFTLHAAIVGSDVSAANMLYCTISNGAKYAHEATYNISVSDTKLDVNKALVSRTAQTASDRVNIYLADGVKLGTNVVDANYTTYNVYYDAAASKIVNSSLDADCDYIVSSAYDPYTYQLGGQDAETFYWNQAEGEVVNPSKVVTLPESALYKYNWVQDGNAFTTEYVNTLALGAKSNLTLCDYIYFNLFINKAQYDAVVAAGATVSGITVDENTEIANIDGTDYYKIQIKDIKLEDADKAVITVGVSYTAAYGETYSSEKTFSVLGYAENILNKSTDEKSVALIESLLNYIVAACNYATVDASAVAEKAAALIEGKEFGAIAGEAKYEALEGVEVAIRYGNVLYLGVKANAGDVITVSYTSADDNAVSITKTADENGEIYVAIKAYDFASDLTITRGADSATMNIQGYYNALADDAAAQAMVEAIYNYATAAAAYKATMAN